MPSWISDSGRSARGSIVWIVLVSLALMLPALLVERTLAGDSHIHIHWQSQFGSLVWSSTPYPRWLPDMNYRFGSPAFFFYPPLLQWTGALFAPIFPGPANATMRISLALWALSAAGGLGCWYWVRAMGLRGAAPLLAALAYVLMPYRSYFDIYQRGALPELAGISVMPWLLCFAQRLKNGTPGAWGGYALSVAMILYSHLPAAEMGLIYATCYVLVLADRTDWLRFLLKAGTATIAGFMASALCIATALGLLKYIPNPTNMWGDRNQPVHWLLFSHERWQDPGVYVVVVALFVFTCVTSLALGAVSRRIESPMNRKIAWFLVISTLVILVLNMEPTRFFWAAQTPLSRIQFPFRLFSLTVLALSGLGALTFAHLQDKGFLGTARLRALAFGGFLVGLLFIDVALFAVHAWHSRGHPPLNNAEILAEDTDTGEYVIGDIKLVRARFGDAAYLPLQGEVSAKTTTWDSRHISFDLLARGEGVVALRQFAFTGWKCRIDGGAWQAPQSLPQPLNLPTCAVPPGPHRLDAVLDKTPVERVGGWLTLFGLLIALADVAGVTRRLGKRPAAA